MSPRAAVVFQTTAAQTCYFSYGTSSNPSAEALTLAANNVGAAPEKNRTFELGAKWDLLKNMLGIRTALFRIEKTNARTPDPVLGVMTLDGEQRVQGFELEVAINRANQAIPNHPSVVSLTCGYHNLLRGRADA